MGRDVTSVVTIAVPVGEAVAWFERAENLPAWTGFFTSVRPAEEPGRYHAETKIGPITSWVERAELDDGYEVSICSLIRGRVERARLWLASAGAGTRAEFRVHLLHDPDEAAVAAQRGRMAGELAAARRILEGAVAA